MSRTEDAALHAMKQNIMKEEFGWEVPVESVPLPTRGVLYSPDSTLYNRETVPIKAMTAHEEDILTSQAFIKEGTVISQLLSSCLTDKSIQVNDLTLGDRNSIMTAVRITGYGSEYKVIAKCESCNASNKVAVNLSNLDIKRLELKPIEPGKNEFEYVLPVTKKKVTFKFMTVKDEIDRSKASQSLANMKFESNITSYLRYVLLSVDGVRDKTKISHFVRHMPAFDSKSLRKFINEHEPGIDMTENFTCDKCGYHNQFGIPVTTEFFWPDT